MKPEKKKIILGVTGGIAAYKSADLCSKLTGAGFDVHVIMTASAQQLITQRCFLTLSRNPVICSLWDVPDWKPEHIELSESADLCVVAPCTANFIGKYTHGIADDALTTTALAFSGTMLLAPAMNCRMWRSPAVRDNCAILRKRGVHFIGPEKGRLACGDEDVGRMSEVPQIVEKIRQLLAGNK